MNSPQTSTQQQTVVIGGGIVGVCCALYLQREGHRVILVDPAAPGDSTAKWSCGQMAVSEVIPLSKPGILKKIPGWLMDQKGPLALRPSALPGILPWFLRFLACARHARIVEIAGEMATLTEHVYEDYAPLLEACPDKTLLGQRPIIEVFDSADGVAHERPHLELRKALGFQSEELGADEIADLEPSLAGKFKHGLLFPDWRAVSDTEGFIAALTQSFIEQGGARVRELVKRIDSVDDRATGVTLADGARIAAQHVVVAAGTGSRAFFSQLGVSVPLAGIAGYQVVLPQPEVEFRHSVIYADGGFCFSPMTRGLQIGGTIEFAAAGAEPNFKRADIILEKARRVLPQLNTDNLQYGVGYRPFLPDTKPIIDRSERLTNVYMAFGHGQLGLTLGATTGRLIADMTAGRPTAQNLKPFSAKRFALIGGHA
ncbi:NAD(P)/FAD-dependent oxidoreductase [Pseudomonas mediterranea]|uniref:D-amino-acid dehydrogenase n=2 Tax=Pseudomonas mediterranea TaxID=183795 RepID=A0AAX2DEQ2_9PSED|nr:FAD-dependent oxidoreductase [Pseudomonas mediterranea]KGU82923.1 amino acid dehydrogenase [Pseudomonas mediterranea CFBP 5447]MBL0845748.1 FAD-dependent oxidoreductase [Pseudomonas mediterranea]MDU9030776.1 FAD-dependent oxidoreductase [Pseudomonas mediterranea]UZE03266.1 FAD-dependent oxidoreductase [Pseudomonas mediterranea]SDU63575.1 D-amino-acid dehydrogenase [Pseudomonas mediterranea]